MRLLTHNLLICNRKQCQKGFPLKIVLGVPRVTDPRGAAMDDADTDECEITKEEECEFNAEFIKNVVKNKIEWEALLSAVKDAGVANTLPPSVSSSDLEDEMFLRAIHSLCIEYHILEAMLVCPKCSREYPVRKGIPNMLLHDDEV